jgi:F-type H+-transporting ATPase subunit b
MLIGNAYAAATEAAGEHAAGGGGLPQFDANYFSSQIFWTIVSFVTLMVLLWKYVIPAITNVLDARNQQIKNDLDGAEQLRTKAEETLARYKKDLAAANQEAAQIIDQTQKEAAKRREQALKELDEELLKKKNAATEQIEQAKRQALAEVKDAVIEATILATEQLIRKTVTKADADQLVDNAIQHISDERAQLH